MKWSNVSLIFSREMRDQVRDRRTLFTVVILPLLLYPVMGMALLQVAQFMRDYPTQVWVVGAENLPSENPLIVNGQISPQWASETERELLQLTVSDTDNEQFQMMVNDFRNKSGNETAIKLIDQVIQEQMKRKGLDLAVFVPKTISASDDNSPDSTTELPAIYIFLNSANDKSKIAQDRFERIANRWKTALIQQKLEDHQIAATLMQPFKISSADVAANSDKQAAIWSKMLPFIVMIWSLTGAFYPAVDLCAGEKERGTFETLLSSPAHRSEIAIGKLLTVMSFSIATSLLNLLSMGFTGLFVFTRLSSLGPGMGAASIGPPPVAAIGWLLLALIPISALFSAMALAAAAFARSSKEGQYYLIPLMMISMPLMMLPMLPAAQLDIGTSLIPVSGLMLLLRGLIEGQYAEVLQFGGPVVAVTLVCCWMAIRWVVRQFNSETVLFRASERFGVGAWVRQVMHHRHELPSIGNALLCAIMILVVKFFVSFGMSAPGSWGHFAKQTVISLLATVGMPALLMAIVLTRNPGMSLRLNSCRLPVCAAAILAAICLHPLLMWFTTLVMYIYPPTGDLIAMELAISHILGDAPGLWAILLVFAVSPAIMEELAFRGFILSGFQRMKGSWGSILLTSLFFGLAHSVLQQSIVTFVVGVILGWIAVRTNSLIPCVLYHATHNGITVMISFCNAQVVNKTTLLSWALQECGDSYQYTVVAGILMSVVGVLVMAWLLKNPSGHNVNARPLFNAKTIEAWINRWRVQRAD